MGEREWLLATERMQLGIWRESDAGLAEEIWGDPQVTALTGGPFSTHAITERLALEVHNWRTHGIQYWPLFRLSDLSLIGCCGLRPRGTNASAAELGFQLCPGAWGQGFASEAAKGVIAWARERGFSSLIAGHHPANHASKRALVGLGFRYTHDELYPPTGQMEPCYALHIGPDRPSPSPASATL